MEMRPDMTPERLDHDAGRTADSAPPRRTYHLTCWECGAAYEALDPDRKFCQHAHAKAFHNRAAMRGAILYHLFMAMRYERGVAKGLGVWSAACKIASHWREEDQRERQGRPSWLRAREVLDRNAWILKPVVLVRGFRYQRPATIRRDDGA
jgi:hypothetical protein